MSRFFQTSHSDSESESSLSEEEILPQKTAIGATNMQFSDEEEETKRIVRSAKEKRFEELTTLIKQVRNHKKIKDMSKLLTGFEDLTRAFIKAKPVIDKEEHGVIPKFYIRCLVEIEDFVNECWEDREGRKNMSKNNSKSLTTLRQKIRKYNKDFDTDTQKYRENPDVEDEDRDESDRGSDDDDDADSFTADAFKKSPSVGLDSKARIAKDEDDDDDSDSMVWSESSEDELTSSSDEEGHGGNLASKFLKKAGADKDVTDKKVVDQDKRRDKKKKREERRRDEDEDEDDGEGEWKEVVGGVPLFTEKPKMFAKDAEINVPVVVKKLSEILAARGKKGTDRTEQIGLLQDLHAISEKHSLGPGVSIKVRFAVIAAIYDYNPNIATCMKSDTWNKCLEHINDLLDKLVDNPTIVVGEHIMEDSENLSTPPYKIRGCILSVVERMEEEYIKMLQGCDAHSNEYVERLKDEGMVCNIIERLQSYLESRGTPSEMCRIYLRRVEHVYYKQQVPESEARDTSIQLMDRLCKFIYAKDNTDRIRTRAMLCHIYHNALHDMWFAARDLMLMSHLQSNIHNSDVPTQILYNRTMVQLGLCAFRHGNITDSHNCLLDIQSGGRAKELLAQGLLLQRQHERSSEQEKIEKRRQMPFHMHINLEQLECVYLVSAMLLEIPYMAGHEFDTRRRMISKSFHHQLKVSEKQALVGPPESMREHVVAASKAMRNGNWKACRNFIINEKMNGKVWDLFHQADKVREMLARKIQEESLRTYLFTYSSVYDSISMVMLADMFELDKSVVHSIISKMVINEELMASLDEPTQTVVMHRTEPSRLQSLALQLAEKVSNLVENNERVLEMRQGSFFNRNQGQQDRGYQRQYRDYQQDRGSWNKSHGRDNADNRGSSYRGRRQNQQRNY